MESRREVVAEKAYLYSLWKDDKLRVYEGYVYKTSDVYSFEREHEFHVRCFFMIDGVISSREKKNYNCGEEEGEIYNKVLWLKEPDEQRAKGIFIEYERRQIEQLEEKIEKHRKLIKLLEE